jgi:hypothetical protein
MVVVIFMDVYANKIEKDELQVNKMPSAKYLWRLHIGMLKPTPSIRAFGDPLVRARKAGRLMNRYTYPKRESWIGLIVVRSLTANTI